MIKTSPSNAGDASSIPGRGVKITHALGLKNQNIKQKQYCDKFNKDFKNSPYHTHTQSLTTKNIVGKGFACRDPSARQGLLTHLRILPTLEGPGLMPLHL